MFGICLELLHTYGRHEQEKKRVYGERILEIEKSSFTPLIFSTSGGMGHEATIFHKRLASQIAEKRKEDYNQVMNYIRTRLRFCILKSTLVALRGYRGKKNEAESISNISLLSVQDCPRSRSKRKCLQCWSA